MLDLNKLKALALSAKAHSDTIGEDEWYTGTENMSIFAPSPDLSLIAALTPDVVLEWHTLTERLQSELTAAHQALDGAVEINNGYLREIDALKAERAAKAQGAAPAEIWRLIDAYADARAEYERSTERHLAKQQRENVADAKAEVERALAPSIQALPVVAPTEAPEPLPPLTIEQYGTAQALEQERHRRCAMRQAAGEKEHAKFEAWAKARTDTKYYLKLNSYRLNEGNRWYDSERTQHTYEGFAAAQPEAKEAPAAPPQDSLSLPGWLRHFAADGGYSHSDYADTMKQAADEIERLDTLLSAAGNSQDAKDAALLDFIEAHPEKQLRCVKKRWAFVGFTNYPYEVFGTVREAITAAMAAAPSPAEGA